MVKRNVDTEALYKEVATLMVEQRQCVALTGAGVSAESGIPTFRSKGGLWEKYDPIEFASIEAFRKDPSKYWSLRGEFIKDYDRYQPNKAHLALAELEQMGIVRCVITQNIDGLHKKAGSKNVIEIHGNLMEIICLTCGKEYKAPNIPDGMPPHCSCGGILKPNTVLFGEELPMDVFMKAQEESASCKIMLLIGTSAIVQPAASLPYLAIQNRAKIIEINIENAFPDADYFIIEKAGTALSRIVAEVNKFSHE
ncbi:MAG TPA: SIR2 family NAD-dependent protein deacylase [Candidatus Wunengus sp. YC63]|uniref:SIR2 family NAD-dependent protein deacylase n=1 Tax=unclassified Candidatus Wunengus TaxID=3367695 RepID=UPI004024D8DE